MVFADGALLAYSITLPLFSQFYLTFHDVLRTLSPDVHDTLANPIPLLFSLLMSYGWFINMLFWTHCEIYDTNDGMCPAQDRTSGDEYSKGSIRLDDYDRLLYSYYRYGHGNPQHQ
jgi:hypothetical protein